MMPLSIEYLAFAAFSFLIIFLQYGFDGFRKLSLAPTFLAAMGVIYTIDNLYPYGQFVPLQLPAAATATFAQMILNLMGYQTSMTYETTPRYGWTPILEVRDSQNPLLSTRLGIAWPCSGVESLIIYTLFMLIFLRELGISRIRKVIYFMIGAIITYFINVGRIIALFMIAINFGVNSLEFWRFHDFYAQLISISWIALYPLLIIMGGDALHRIRSFARSLKMRLFS